MPDLLQDVLTYTLFPVVATILGGAIAAWRPPGRHLQSMIQHFAAGVIFAVIAAEVLPEATAEPEPFALFVGFALGVGAMLGLRRLTKPGGVATAEEAEGTARLIATVAVDVVLVGAGASPGKVIATTAGLALLLAISAAVGALLLGDLTGAPFVAVLAFATAALLYLVTEELLVEAHEVPETPVSAAVFFVGFLALLLLETVA